MFVVLQFPGHSAVLLTGLGNKSRLLHITGSSFPSKSVAIWGEDSPSRLMQTLEIRVLIPSKEDFNDLGVSEAAALDFWRYVKASMYSKKYTEELGRKGTIDTFYDNFGFFGGFNCATFAAALLLAALPQGLNVSAPFLTTPAATTKFAIAARDAVLQSILTSGVKAYYGMKLENLHTLIENQCYVPDDNLGCALPGQFLPGGTWMTIRNPNAFSDMRLSEDEVRQVLWPLAQKALRQFYGEEPSNFALQQAGRTVDTMKEACKKVPTVSQEMKEALALLSATKKAQTLQSIREKETRKNKVQPDTPYQEIAAIAQRYHNFERLTPRSVKLKPPKEQK